MKNKVSRTLRNILLGGVFSLGLAGGMNKVSGQSLYERVIINPHDTPPKTEVSLNSNWSDLDSSNKVNYLEWAIANDSTTFKRGNKLCGDYAEEICTNFNGFTDMPIDDSLGTQNNGKYGIPTFKVDFVTDLGGHIANGVFIGSNTNSSITDLNQWYLFDGSIDKHYASDDLKNVTGINISAMNYDSLKQDFNQPTRMVEFGIIDGKLKATRVNEAQMVNKSLKMDKNAPNILLSLEDYLFNPKDNLNIYVSDSNFLDSLKYSIDGDMIKSYKIDSATIVSPLSKMSLPKRSVHESIILSQEEGQHSVEIESNDIANAIYGKTSAKKSFNYIIDTTAPSLNASINPISGTDSANISVSAYDKYLKSAEYSINGSDWKYFSNDTSFKTKLDDGINTLKVRASDKANNNSGLERTLLTDFTKPELSYTGVEDGKVYNSNVEGRVIAKDEHLNDYGYKFIKNGEKSFPQKLSLQDYEGDFNFDLENGKYAVQFYANDTYGNETLSDTVEFSVDKTTGLENITSNSKSNVYPNPVSTTATVNYTPKGEDFDFKVYNMNGQEVYNQKDIDNDGEMNINLSNYKSGVYVYKANDGSSGKIIKK